MPIKAKIRGDHRIEVIGTDLAELVRVLSPWVSEDGLFIASATRVDAGREVEVRVALEDGLALVEGRGQVLWARERVPSGPPPGFAVRFDELTPESRELLRRLVSDYRETGRRGFDLVRDAPVDFDEAIDPTAIGLIAPLAPLGPPSPVVPEPLREAEEQVVEDPALRAVRELDADSDDGVGVLNTGVSPSFAPGMGSAKAMRGVTVAPLSSTLIGGSEGPDGLEPPVRDESAGVRPFSVDLAIGSEHSAEEAPFHEEDEDDDDFHLEFGVIEPKLPTHALEADSGIDEIWTAISATEERMLGSGEHAPATAASSDAMTPRPDEGTFQTVALSSAELKELTQRQGSGSATPLLPTEEDRGGAELEPDLDRLTGSIDLSSIAIPDSGVRLDSASWTPPAPSELDAPPPPLLAPRPPKPPAGGGESKERSISSGESWSNRALESSAALRGLGERDIHSGLSPPAAGSVSPGAAPSAATRDSSAMRRRPDLPPQKRSSQTLPKKAQSSPPRLMELTILLVLAVGIIVAYIYGQDLYQRLTVVAPTPEPAGDPSLGEPPAPIFESLDPNDEAVSLLDLSRIQDGVPLVDVRVATPVASPVTNILRITYGSYEERGTEIVLWGDGSFSALNTSLLRLPGEAPRQLVRVGGIEAPHPNPSYILESSSEVTALRIEYHIADPYNEVQLVAELGSAEVQLVNVQVVDRRLILRFERLTPRRRR